MTPLRKFSLLLAAAVLASACTVLPVAAATITILNGDAAGEGFNDPTPAAPVPGNPGATVGAQRLFVFQHAANLWAAILPSAVTIRIAAQFNPLSCNATSGVLGSAGPTGYQRDFPGAPLAGHWYPYALASKLQGIDTSPGDDISIQFNSSVGQPTCLTVGWYYGVDGNEGTQIELLPVVLHEMGHGLGFLTPTNKLTGAYLSSFPSIYDHFLYDNDSGLHWDEMSAAQRVASVNTCTKLAWDGSAVVNYAPSFLGDKPVLRINSAPIAGDYAVGLATFGPPLGAPITGDIVIATDGDAYPTNGCEAITNDVTGKIALIDRGTCGFAIKVKNAQDAGAIAVIVADTVAGCPPAGMGGVDATITIPSVRVTQADGALIKANLLGGVNATLILDPNLMAGADAAGRVLVYTPSTVATGSSVSHWDVSAEPNLLMEPSITTSVSSDVDLAKWLFWDIGWFQELVAVDPLHQQIHRLGANSPNPFGGRTTIHFALDREDAVMLGVYDLSGRLIRRLHQGPLGAGDHAIPWDGQDVSGRRMPPGIYLYTLETGSRRESRHMVLMR
jgi:PA domain/FlgD Ig-like domain